MPKRRSADQWGSMEAMQCVMDEAKEAIQMARREVEAFWAVTMQAGVE